jgi:hypothetical protein
VTTLDQLDSDKFRAEVERRLAGLNPTERVVAARRLDREVRNRRARKRFPSPGALARYVQPDTVQTQLMDALDRVALECQRGTRRRWVISCPPQEGKSVRMGQVFPLWLLINDPSRRIAIASYEQGLSGRNSLQVRQWIETHGGGYRGDRTFAGQDDELGLLLDPDNARQTAWSLADVPGRRSGGIIAVGVGSAFTGRAADVLIVDDPVKDAKQADSEEQRKISHNWFQAVAEARLGLNAIVVVIQTRWHEDDLTGWLLRKDSEEITPEWSQLIVPAQATVDDPLGRAPGEFLESARGERDWAKIKKRVGERWWAALYLCKPSPPAGGVFKEKWFDRNRVAATPELLRIEVFVDPADNEGTGDEAGVMVMGAGGNEDYYLLEDLSGHMTVSRWSRVALLACLRHKAGAVRYERSLSQLGKRIKMVWRDLLIQAKTLDEEWRKRALPGQAWPTRPHSGVVAKAVHLLQRKDATAEELVSLEAELAELWPQVPAALAIPETGPSIRSMRAEGSKTTRAQLVAPLVENDHVKHVGHFPEFERQAITWQEGQDSPDRMDAWVHGLTVFSGGGVGVELTGATGQMPTRSAGRPGGSTTIGRSTNTMGRR